MKKIFFVALSLSFFNWDGYAQDTLVSSVQTNQTYAVRGRVLDERGEAVVGAEINLKQEEQNILSSFSGLDGAFELEDLNPGTYELEIYYVGYQVYRQSISITDNSYNLDNIELKPSKEELEAVTVIGEVRAVKQDGDTTMYDARAYKTNPDATAEDLIRKMPGIDLSDGQPKAQGEQIGKVLVDGKPFFGDDVNATLRNLPAEVIASIQIYDERSEQSRFSGFDDGNTTKTLNIVTREDKRQGVFGKVYAGYGADTDFEKDYYNAGFAINSFKGNQRITLLGQTNNINIQNFSSEDLGISQGGGRGGRGGGGGRPGGGGRGRMGGGPGGGGSPDGDMFMPRNGITTTHALGLNYSNQWTNKFKISGSYFFNNARTNALEDIRRTYVGETSAGQYYTENNVSQSEEFSHRINARMEFQPDSSHYFIFEPSLRIQNTRSNSEVLSKNFFDEAHPLNATQNTYTSDGAAVQGSYSLFYNYQFAKPRRTLSLYNMSGFNNRNSESYLMAVNTFEDTALDYETDQQSLLDNKGWNTYANLNYTEPLNEKYTLLANAGIRYLYSESDKKTYDADSITHRYEHLNTELSNEFVSRYTTPFAGLAIGYKDAKIMWNAGANYQYALLDNERVLPYENNIKKGFQNILPYAMFTYDLGNGSSIRLRYRTSTNTPSVNQLQDVIDNSNPLILRTGNPELNQNYQHRLFANYRTSNPMNNSTFFAMIMSEITQDYVANHTIIAQEDMEVDGVSLARGMQYIKPVNLNGQYRLMGHTNYGIRVKPIKSNLNLSLMLGTTRTPGMINNELNYAQNNTVGVGLGLSSNISEYIDFNVSTNANYSNVKNTLNTSANNAFYNQTSRLDINYLTPFGLFVNTQLQHQYYEGIGNDFSQNFLLWNAAVGYKFLKNRQAEVRLQAYDILNQNQAISRTFTDIYTQDTRSNVLTQYFMLSFTYNLRYFKGNSTEKDFSGNESGRPQRMHM